MKMITQHSKSEHHSKSSDGHEYHSKTVTTEKHPAHPIEGSAAEERAETPEQERNEQELVKQESVRHPGPHETRIQHTEMGHK